MSSAELADFVRENPRLFVLTGAGVSTGSGIPAYRDAEGRWSRSPPMTHQQFTRSESARKRYWARSLVGWPAIARAAPNPAHDALARLERSGSVARLVTQNVDGLHQRAGSNCVIDLHGRLDRVVCLDCGATLSRASVQREMEEIHPGFARRIAEIAPDGDADLEADLQDFATPCCPACGGVLKPDVVFFGDGVPRSRVDACFAALEEADALLIVGSSLMAYSGYRFCERAHELSRPIAALNRGRTRADDLLALKVEEDCVAALAELASALANRAATIDIHSRARHDAEAVRYQLILRFPGDAFDDFDDIVELETALGERGTVETHDVGSDECRIALLTADPVRAFSEAKAILERKGLLEASVALYRPVGGKDYTVLWPRESDADARD